MPFSEKTLVRKTPVKLKKSTKNTTKREQKLKQRQKEILTTKRKNTRDSLPNFSEDQIDQVDLLFADEIQKNASLHVASQEYYDGRTIFTGFVH